MRATNAARTVAALLALSFLATACGDDSASSDDDSSGSASGGTSEEALATAQEMVDAATKTTGWDWNMPTETFDPGDGKVAIISLGAGIPAQAAISQFAEDAADTLGWDAKVYDGEVSTATIGNYVTEAVNSGYKAIVLQSVDVNAIQAPVDAALEAGVAIACISCLSNGYEDKVHDSAPNWDEQGENVAAYMMTQTDGKAKILGLPDNAFPAVSKRMDAMAAYLEANCAGCTYETTTFTVDQLSSAVPQAWSAALSTHPDGDLTDAVAPYDDAAALFAKASKQAGRDDIRISSMDLTTGSLALYESGDYPLGATTVSPYEYEAWAAIDQVARQLAGLDSWDSTGAPSPLVVDSNASEFVGATFSPSDFDYKAEFAGLWDK